RRAEAAREYSNAVIVENYSKLMEFFSELDLIVLATPPNTHVEQGVAALGAGLALVIDKPFAPSVAEAKRLISIAEAKSLPIMVFQNRRWDGDFLTLKSLIDDKRLGEVVRFESSFEHYSPIAKDRWKDQLTSGQGGGITFDLGSHLIDQAVQLFGPVKESHADIYTLRDGAGNDDYSEIDLVHESNVHSHLTASRIANQPKPRFRVTGTSGTFVSYGLDSQEAALAAGVRPNDPNFGVAPASQMCSLFTLSNPNLSAESIPMKGGNYAKFYEGVARAVRGEGPSPVDVSEALYVVQVIESLFQKEK
ncbi:MAG: Gfo/Idh/MocA family oxidoreductase, partial [Actinobacteria bacterium]|nr:Gfo/Idh/MocA family oxidoreductase [Actinomycetota bacterium]